jgi:hypothetical protein
MHHGPKKGGQPGSFAAIAAAKSVEATYQLHRSLNVPAETNAPAERIANHGDRVGADAVKCEAHLIKLSVASDGASYTISLPSTGHTRTFRTKG